MVYTFDILKFSFSSKIYSPVYQRSTTSGGQDIGIRKFKFVASIKFH